MSSDDEDDYNKRAIVIPIPNWTPKTPLKIILLQNKACKKLVYDDPVEDQIDFGANFAADNSKINAVKDNDDHMWLNAEISDETMMNIPEEWMRIQSCDNESEKECVDVTDSELVAALHSTSSNDNSDLGDQESLDESSDAVSEISGNDIAERCVNRTMQRRQRKEKEIANKFTPLKKARAKKRQ